MYEAYAYGHLPDDRLKLRFHRISCNALVRTKKSSAKRNALKRQKDAAAAQAQQKSTTNPQEVTDASDHLRLESVVASLYLVTACANGSSR